jgi:predicted metal-binding protein
MAKRGGSGKARPQSAGRGGAGSGRAVRGRAALERLIGEHGYKDFKWIKPKDIVVADWVRMKCLFGCKNYGRNASCPPNVPSVAECRRFFYEYRTGVIFHFEKRVKKPEDRHAWTRGVSTGLLKLERAVFLAGYHKVFLLVMDTCSLCAACPGVRGECRNPASARPTPEAMAVDVFSTARQYDYRIEVLSDYSQTMNRFAFLLIE